MMQQIIRVFNPTLLFFHQINQYYLNELQQKLKNINFHLIQKILFYNKPMQEQKNALTVGNIRYQNEPSAPHIINQQSVQNNGMSQSNQFLGNNSRNIMDPEYLHSQNIGTDNYSNRAKSSDGGRLVDNFKTKSKNKIRMYGSKKTIVAYTAFINENSKIDEDNFNRLPLESKISKQNNHSLSHFQRPHSSNHQKVKKKVIGSRKNISPSINYIEGQKGTENKKSNLILIQPKIKLLPINNVLKDISKKQALRPKVFGRQRKISAQIVIVGNEQEFKQKSNEKKEFYIEKTNKNQKLLQKQSNLNNSDDIDMEKLQKIQQKYLRSNEENHQQRKEQKVQETKYLSKKKKQGIKQSVISKCDRMPSQKITQIKQQDQDQSKQIQKRNSKNKNSNILKNHLQKILNQQVKPQQKNNSLIPSHFISQNQNQSVKSIKFLQNNKKSSIILTPTKKIKARIDEIQEKVDDKEVKPLVSTNKKQTKIFEYSKASNAYFESINQCSKQSQGLLITSRKQKESSIGSKSKQGQLNQKQKINQLFQKAKVSDFHKQYPKQEKNDSEIKKVCSEKKHSIRIGAQKTLKAFTQQLKQPIKQENNKDQLSNMENKSEQNNNYRQSRFKTQKRPSIVMSSNKTIKAYKQQIKNQNEQTSAQKLLDLKNIQTQIDFILQNQFSRISNDYSKQQSRKNSKNIKQNNSSNKSITILSSNKNINAYIQQIKQPNVQKKDEIKDLNDSNQKSQVKKVEQINIQSNQTQLFNRKLNYNYLGTMIWYASVQEAAHTKDSRQERVEQYNFILSDSDKKYEKPVDGNHPLNMKQQQQIPSTLVLRLDTYQNNPDDQHDHSMSQREQQPTLNDKQSLKNNSNQQNNQYPITNQYKSINQDTIFKQQKDSHAQKTYSQLQVENTPQSNLQKTNTSNKQKEKLPLKPAQQSPGQQKDYDGQQKKDIKVDEQNKQIQKQKQIKQVNFILGQQKKPIDNIFNSTQQVESQQKLSQNIHYNSQQQITNNSKKDECLFSQVIEKKLTNQKNQVTKQQSRLEQNKQVKSLSKDKKQMLAVCKFQNTNQNDIKVQSASNKNNKNQSKMSKKPIQKTKQDKKDINKQIIHQTFENDQKLPKKQDKPIQNKQNCFEKQSLDKSNGQKAEMKNQTYSPKSLIRKGSQFEIIPLNMNNKMTNTEKIKHQQGKKSQLKMSKDLSQRSQNNLDQKGSLKALVRISPRQYKQNQKQQASRGNSNKSIEQFDTIQLDEQKYSNIKQKDVNIGQNLLKRPQKIKKSVLTSNSQPNLIKKVGLYKFKQNQDQNSLNKQNSHANLKNNKQNTRNADYDYEQKIEQKSKLGNRIYNSQSKNKKNENNLIKRTKASSPYLQPAFNCLRLKNNQRKVNDYNQNLDSYRNGNQQWQKQQANDYQTNQWRYRAKKCKQNNSPKENKIFSPFNQRQIQKFREQYEKIKKIQEDQSDKKRSNKRYTTQKVMNRQYQQANIQRHESHAKSFKYLKAHSHQFSYLYPTKQLQQSQGKLNKKLKQLDKKLKRCSYNLNKNHDEVHQYISQARRQVRESEKYLAELN